MFFYLQGVMKYMMKMENNQKNNFFMFTRVKFDLRLNKLFGRSQPCATLSQKFTMGAFITNKQKRIAFSIRLMLTWLLFSHIK